MKWWDYYPEKVSSFCFCGFRFGLANFYQVLVQSSSIFASSLLFNLLFIYTGACIQLLKSHIRVVSPRLSYSAHESISFSSDRFSVRAVGLLLDHVFQFFVTFDTNCSSAKCTLPYYSQTLLTALLHYSQTPLTALL